MKRISQSSYCRIGVMAWITLGTAVLTCLFLLSGQYHAEAACNSADGERFEIVEASHTIEASMCGQDVSGGTGCVDQALMITSRVDTTLGSGDTAEMEYEWSGGVSGGEEYTAYAGVTKWMTTSQTFTEPGVYRITNTVTGIDWDRPNDDICSNSVVVTVTVARVGNIIITPENEELWNEFNRLAPGEEADVHLEGRWPTDRKVIWTFTLSPEKDAQSPNVVAHVSLGGVMKTLDENYPQHVFLTPVSPTAVPTVKTGDGCDKATVTVRVEDEEMSCCFVSREVPIGCASCGAGYCTMGDMSTENSCVDVRFLLGRIPYGGSAGSLWLFSETQTVSLATPQALTLPDDKPARAYTAGYLIQEFKHSTVILSSTNNAPRQIVTTEGLADIVVSNDFAYELAFYSATNVGGTSTSGLYTNTGPWHVKYLVENPDGTNAYNRLRITRFDAPDDPDDTNVSQYVWTEATKQWALTTGNGIRTETQTTSSDGTYTNVTRIVKDASGTAVSVSSEKYEPFAWGLSMVEQVIGSNGVSLTTTRTYYENVAENGRYSRIKLEVSPDGAWREYDYNSDGLTIKVVSGFMDSPTNAADSEARVVEYDYSLRVGETAGLNPFSPRTVRSEKAHV